MTDNDNMNEAPRPDPGFSVYVHHHNGETINVTDAVMDVYDIAINSMDFGSGFLSTEEVGNLRALGEAIRAQRFDYQHDKCLRCGHDYERHAPEYVDGVMVAQPCRHFHYGANYVYIDPAEQPCSCLGYVRPETVIH